MVLEFYYDMVSSGCRAVYFLLKEGGVPFELKLVELQKGEHLQPEFVEKNPYHKLPTIDDNGYILTESAAILKYVAIKYDLPMHWYPWDDVEKSAKVDEYLHWHHLNIRKECTTILLELGPSHIENFLGIPKRPANKAVVLAAKSELQAAVKNIEGYYLKDKEYIGGDEISIADLCAFAELTGLRAVNQTSIYEDNPVVDSWIKRVEERLKDHIEFAMESIQTIRKQYDEAQE